MVHTIGLLGVNGRVGNAVAKALLPAVHDKKVKLVLFHREGKAPKDIEASDGIEFRIIDLNSSVTDLAKIVKGIQVFISALGFEALPSEPKLVEALSQSPDLVTYIPSTYSAPWTDEQISRLGLGPSLEFIRGGWYKAKELGVGDTVFFTGGFDDYQLAFGFTGSPIKGNAVWASEKQLQHGYPFSLIAHLGDGIAQVLTRDPQSIKGKAFSIVTYRPTGQELVDLYTKINGKPAHVKPFGQSDMDALLADAKNFGQLKAAYMDHWEKDDWGYEDNGRELVQGFNGPSLEETARKYA